MLTCSYKDRRAGGRCRDDGSNSAPTIPRILGEENSLILKVVIQTH